ncbi:hypothetical protein GJV52_02375 [Neisseria brasiliensis]|uniref:hypothetical protein n=1 Tax=Neisseria brasiliensis TaxID=2666100 RepID=UPI0012AA91A6|nr:hypothetical protein GJV52_02375 [Neisseria brasiliensis]
MELFRIKRDIPFMSYGKLTTFISLVTLYSSVVVSRALVNLWYGRKRKLQSISIGSVWKPEPVASNTVVDKE